MIVAGAAPRSAWGRTEADVLIIGAGLAGLNAAHFLEQAGARVAILEGERRVGGRLHTLDDLPGAPDAGGIQVGAGYTRLHRIAAELEVALDSGPGEGAGRVQVPGNLYHVNGVSVPSSGWAESAANHLPDTERESEPASLLRRYARAFPALADTAAWLDADPALDVSVEEALRSTGASVEARRLIEANFNGTSLAAMSQLHLARTFTLFRSQPGPISTIAGGSQRLPEAMAARLSVTPRVGQVVTGIEEAEDGVTVTTQAGTLHARHVICTIPFAALRTIDVRTPVPPAAARMMAALPYTRASFAYIAAKTPFWNEDGLPRTLWTDEPLLGRVFILGDDPAMLKLWTTGAGADLLDRMPAEAAKARIVAAIEAARPAAKGQLEVLRFYSWQRSPFARGIYHHIGTGQAADLASTTRYEGRRLHFAGEHLAQQSSGMEGALETGERSARRVAALL
ncbi:MAG: NAD(P)/FAD-dependent oxidoreductase [Pacificimonas sp.]|jgi:monoamine oxidase|nr:NAD(P)/FAD-dependent oxidoreductase [Pacificimonas sp.]